MRAGAALGLGALAALGCGPPDFGAFCRSRSAVVCDKAASCPGTLPKDECLQCGKVQCECQRELMREGKATYRGEKAETCLQRLGTANCSSLNTILISPPCSEAFELAPGVREDQCPEPPDPSKPNCGASA